MGTRQNHGGRRRLKALNFLSLYKSELIRFFELKVVLVDDMRHQSKIMLNEQITCEAITVSGEAFDEFAFLRFCEWLWERIVL